MLILAALFVSAIQNFGNIRRYTRSCFALLLNYNRDGKQN